MLLSDFTNIKTCWQQASKLIGLKKSLTSRSIEYWTIRGWDPLTAKFKAKEISKKIPSNSPFSAEHWIKKIQGADLTAVDTETTGLDALAAELVGISIATL